MATTGAKLATTTTTQRVIRDAHGGKGSTLTEKVVPFK